MRHPQQIWEKAIILVDMNAFFASVEQRDYPEWRGLPVAVTNGVRGTCIITSSYEARAYGIKTGMRLKEGRRLCPGLIQCPARPDVYASTSAAIMEALQTRISPDIEIFSVDEAFLDITRCQRLLGAPPEIARQTQRLVHEVSGVLCSVGVSGDKTTAKYAAKLMKPNGLTVIPPWESEARLRNIPVTELCGINKGIGGFLAERGVHVCGDMKHLPISVLANRFGNPGRRIWYMAQGKDPEPVITHVPPPKSIGHGKVMPPDTKDESVIRTYLLHMSEKVAARLRKHQMEASHFFIGLRGEFGWFGDKLKTVSPTDDGCVIMKMSLQMLREQWRGGGVSQVQITALNPQLRAMQLDLFTRHDEQRSQVNAVQDAINYRYGEFALAPGRLLKRSDMPNVIAPSWRPKGHRQTI